MLDKIKDFLDDIKHEIEWILAGCPKPVKIPVKSKEKDNESKIQDKS